MNIPLVSPALGYLLENSDTCYAVVTIYRRDGSVVGTEMLSPVAVSTLKNMNDKVVSYEHHLEQSRIRNRTSYVKRRGCESN